MVRRSRHMVSLRKTPRFSAVMLCLCPAKIAQSHLRYCCCILRWTSGHGVFLPRPAYGMQCSIHYCALLSTATAYVAGV